MRSRRDILGLGCTPLVCFVPVGSFVGVDAETLASAAALELAVGVVESTELESSGAAAVVTGVSCCGAGEVDDAGARGMGIHSRGGMACFGCACASVSVPVDDSGNSVSTGLCEGGTFSATLLVGSSPTSSAEGDEDGDCEGAARATFCHFSRTRRRFGVCGPRADSGEKPSKASQALASLGSVASLDTEKGRRLGRWTSNGLYSIVDSRERREKIAVVVLVIRVCMGRRRGTYGPTRRVRLVFCSPQMHHCHF